MDIVSHGLWAGAAAEWIRVKTGATWARVAWTVALGVAPDLVAIAPIVAWSAYAPAPSSLVLDYLAATPGNEPILPTAVKNLTYVLHCTAHSAVVALGATLILLWLRRAWVAVLAGWWLHIALDIATHSQGYYAVPFLYPVSDYTVDGVAWTTPWVLAADYAAIAAAYAAIYAWQRRHRAP